jgi:hypothetical protein
MKPRLSASVLDALLFIVTSAGFVFVPAEVIPLAVWPLALGLAFLTRAGFAARRAATLPDDELGHLLPGVMCLTWDVVLLIDQTKMRLGIAIALGAAARPPQPASKRTPCAMRSISRMGS